MRSFWSPKHLKEGVGGWGGQLIIDVLTCGAHTGALLGVGLSTFTNKAGTIGVNRDTSLLIHNLLIYFWIFKFLF